MARLIKWWRVRHWRKTNWSWRDQSGWHWSSQSQNDLTLKCSKWPTFKCSLTDLEVLTDWHWSAHWLTLKFSLTNLEVLNMDVPLPFGEFGSISAHQNNTHVKPPTIIYYATAIHNIMTKWQKHKEFTHSCIHHEFHPMKKFRCERGYYG